MSELYSKLPHHFYLHSTNANFLKFQITHQLCFPNTARDWKGRLESFFPFPYFELEILPDFRKQDFEHYTNELLAHTLSLYKNAF